MDLIPKAQHVSSKVENDTQTLTSDFSGYHRDTNMINNKAGRPGYRYYQQQNQPAPSNSTSLPPQKLLRATATRVATTASTPLTPQQNGMPLSSISEKENSDSIPNLDGTELTFTKLPVDASQTEPSQPAASSSVRGSSQMKLHVDPPAPVSGRQTSGFARTARTQAVEFSSISSNTNSYVNTVSPVSPSSHSNNFVAQDGAVMRSNLNGTWNRRARQGSIRKHVMSFMEYDTENDSQCSSSRRSSLRGPGKVYLVGDQIRGSDQQDPSWRR